MSAQHPRLRVTPTAHGIPMEINGVTIPVTDWSMGPGGFEFNEGTLQIQMNFNAEFVTEPEPETAEQRAERVKAEQAAAVAEAVGQWQTACREHLELVPAFELHRPVAGYQRVDCAHCEQSDGMESTENAPWPCATYTALTGGVGGSANAAAGAPEINSCRTGACRFTVGDRVHISRDGLCRPGRIEQIHPPETLLITPDGPFVSFAEVATPHDETEPHTNGSWHLPCDGDRAETPPSSVTVNVTVQGSVTNEQALAESIRRALRRPPGLPDPFKR